ncbi:MAG: hypothetical protein V1781_09595 [Bacteroidota bacterium]
MRKTVRVKIPRKNPDPMLVLIDGINEKHVELCGSSSVENNARSSPLDNEDAEALLNIHIKARSEREQAKDFEAKAQSHNQKAREYLGLNKEQGVNSPGTGMYHVIQVRNTLLKKYRGNEEKLSEWGFEVVIGQAKSPKKKS